MTPRGLPVEPEVLMTTAVSMGTGRPGSTASRIADTMAGGSADDSCGIGAIAASPTSAAESRSQIAVTALGPLGTSMSSRLRSVALFDIVPSVGAAGSVVVMDTRTRYPLPPVAPEDSPVWQDPAHSSMRAGCDWETVGDYRDIRYEISTGDDAGIARIHVGSPPASALT